MRTFPPKGFSLIEVLVALAILAVVLSTVSLAVGSADGRAIKLEEQRFSKLLLALVDRAATLSREHRIQLRQHGYQVYELHRGQWRLLESAPFSPRQLPVGMQTISATSMIDIESLGVVVPGSLAFSQGSMESTVSWNLLGQTRK